MRLSQSQVDKFNREGYLVVQGGLEEQDLDPVIQEYEAYIDVRARELQAEGKVKHLHESEPFERRLACICREDNSLYGELDIMKMRGRASFEFLRNENLLDIVEGIVGPEITCSPIQHIRPKLPDGLTPGGHDQHVVPWHQDAGVTWEEADPHFILTVWIPMTEATRDNGCLEVIPGVHGKGLLRHERQGGTHIAEELMPEAQGVALPVRRGDVILIHKEIPHRSTPNRTDGIRWSIDLRYQKTGSPTGRPFHPDFVARSRANPDSVLTNYVLWRDRWIEALGASKGVSAHRWK